MTIKTDREMYYDDDGHAQESVGWTIRASLDELETLRGLIGAAIEKRTISGVFNDDISVSVFCDVNDD